MQRNKMLLSGGVLLVALVGGGVAVTQLEQCSGTQCTMEARASVLVKVVDADGDPVSASSVFYEHVDADADEQLRSSHRGECIDEACTQWVVGRELPGIFAIHASACGGMAHELGVEVGMTEDDCHVDTQEVTLVVDACPNSATEVHQTDPKICSPDLRPAVEVQIYHGDDRQPAPADAVWFGRVANTDDANVAAAPVEPPEIDPTREEDVLRHLATCHDDTCTRWLAGWEQPGHYYVFARTCGQVVQGEVDVPMTEDGCHVDTQLLWLEADRSGCVEDGG